MDFSRGIIKKFYKQQEKSNKLGVFLYNKRIMRKFFEAIDYIEENLTEDISIHDIAAVGCYSTYHFCRMFKGLTGESLKTYVRKRRLTEAGKKLYDYPDRLLDLAMEYQFDSHEAFTRAFKKMFYVTPEKYRQYEHPRAVIYQPKFTADMVEHLNDNLTIQPRIEKVRPIKIMGFKRTIGKTVDHDAKDDIKKLWFEFIPYMDQIPQRVGNHALGICEYNYDMHDMRFDYIAALEIEDFFPISDEFYQAEIPEQTYAIFTHKEATGEMTTVNDTIKYIWCTWLPKSDYTYSGTPDFKLYADRFNEDNLTGEIDFYIPIVPK